MGGDPDARRWLGVYSDPDGKERSRAFASQKRAIAWVTQMAASVERGDWADPALGRGLIDPLAVRWLALREVTAGSRQRYESCYRLHVKPAFGSRPAGSVRPSEVAAWSASLAGHPATRRCALVILSGIFDLAVADGARRDNPARAAIVARPGRPAPLARDGWDAARVRAVARACGQYEALALIVAGLGLRECEGFGLSPADFDYGAGTVTIRRQLTRRKGGTAAKLPKGGAERTVPLPAGVAELARRWTAQHPSEPVTLPWLTEDGTAGEPVTFPLMFRLASGRHVTPLAWERQVWKPALARAGVIPPFGGQDFPAAREHGMHALRHWYSTTLQDGGVSLAGVMEFLGHSRRSAPLAVGVYGHVTEETLEAARRAVDRSLFSLRPVTPDGTVTERRLAR